MGYVFQRMTLIDISRRIFNVTVAELGRVIDDDCAADAARISSLFAAAQFHGARQEGCRICSRLHASLDRAGFEG